MGKILKILLIVGAIAINFIPGVGQAISATIFGAIGTGTFAALGIATTLTSVLTGVLTVAGLSAASSLLRGGGGASQAQLSRLNLSFNAEAPRKIWLGATAGNTDAVYQEGSGTDQEYIDLIIVVAAHAVQVISAIYSEDKLMWSSSGGVTSMYSGYLTVTTVLEGTPGGGLVINSGSIWGANCSLTGCAYVRLRVKRSGNSSKASSPFAAGVPSRLTIEGAGAKVYDPRRDSTVGGSGPHRADNQATWQYADGSVILGTNPVLQTISYLIGWKIGGVVSVGAGLPPSRLAMADWIAAANVADELVSVAGGGTQRRYETHGNFSDDDTPSSVIELLCANMNANLRDTGGKLGIRMAINDLAGPLVAFTEDDILGAHTWQPFAPLNESYNVIRGKWTDPSTTALYQPTPYPAVSVASPDGINRPFTLDLLMQQNSARSQRIAQQVLRRNLIRGVFTADFGPRAWAVECGQPVQLTFGPIGAVAKTFRVIRQELKIVASGDDVAALCPMVLIEEDASIYAWSTGDEQAQVAAVAAVSYLPSSQPFLITQGIDIGVQNGADVTASALPRLELPAGPTINADYTGTVTSGQLPRTLIVKRFLGSTDVSATTTWSITTTGCTATIASSGVITITACAATGKIVVTAVRDGVTLSGEIPVTKATAGAPATGGTGSTIASTSSFTSTNSASYGAANGGPLTVTAGSAGTVTLSAPLEFSVSGSPGGNAYGKWQWRVVGGSYADVATEIISTSPAAIGEPNSGYIEVSQTKTGLSNGTTYEFQLLLRRDGNIDDELQRFGIGNRDMIVIRNTATGERQIVESLNGIDLAVWATTTETPPADSETRAYRSDTVTGLVPVVPPLTLFQFLSLWTPAETLAVINTSDAAMAYYWVRAQASPLLHLDNPLVLAGVAQAQAAGIIDAARAAQILAGQPPA